MFDDNKQFSYFWYTVAGTRIKTEMLQYVQRLVGSFGITVDQSNITSGGGAMSQEALAKKAKPQHRTKRFKDLRTSLLQILT